jgi:hypothetical protein
MQVVRNTTPGAGGGILELTATRGTDVNSYTVLQSGDGVGSVIFGGADGNEFVVAASVVAQVDGTPGDNDMPGRLIFNTTADGASSTTERMRIDSSGNVGIGTSSPSGRLNVAVTTNTGTGADNCGLFVTSTNRAGFAFLDSAASSAASVVFANAGTEKGRIIYYNATDAMAFQTGGSSGTERMRIDASGNVGIGNTAANVNDQVGAVRPLLVSKSDSATTIAGSQANIVIGNANTTTSNTAQLTFAALTGANTTYFAAAAINCIFGARTNGQYPTGQLVFSTSTSLNSAPTEKMRITEGGEVYIAGTTDQGAYNLQCNGTGVWGAGAYVNGSDARLKDDITTLNDGLNVVSQLRPVTFKYKPDYSKDQNVQTGFIAQELQTALEGKDYLDGIVQAGPNHLNVAYQSLIPILTKAIQEQQAMIDELKTKVAALEAK